MGPLSKALLSETKPLSVPEKYKDTDPMDQCQKCKGKDIKKIIREYYKEYYVIKFEVLVEMDNFLEEK